MGTAKFFEEKLERAHCGIADLPGAPVHPAIAKSRSMPGRVPEKLTPAAAAAKMQRVTEKLAAKHKRRLEQSRNKEEKRASAVEAKARELLTTLYPKITKQNERLIKHVKMLEEMVKSQASELTTLRRQLGD